MKATFAVENPGDVAFTLTVTMTLNEWQDIRGALGNGSSSGAVGIRAAIWDMVAQATEKLSPADGAGRARS